MKKIIALLTLTAALGLMTGCTDKDGNKKETSGATSQVTTVEGEETKADETKADETKADETKADETKADETKAE